MAVYQGSLTVKRRPKDGVPGNPGNPGLPGQVPIQKEWVVGDTHRFNDEIKDYIYVRGTSGNTSYWYTRTSKGDDIDAGAAPVGGASVAGYTRVDWLKTLAVNVLLAEEANLANFIFKDEQLISVRGTVNGVEQNYSGQTNFKPYIILDGKTGKIYAEGAEISGVINALNGGKIGGLSIIDGSLKSFFTDTTQIWDYSKFPREYVGSRTVTGQLALSVNEFELNDSYTYQGIPSTRTIRITPAGISLEENTITYNTKTFIDNGRFAIEHTWKPTNETSLIEIFSDGIYFNGQKFTGGGDGYVHPSTHSADMISAGTFAGIVKASNNTSYTTKQVRNMILSTGDAISSQMANGDIWIKYE